MSDNQRVQALTKVSRQFNRLNLNRFGAVVNNHGYVGFDFYYKEERIRTGFRNMRWNDRNAREARLVLDRIGQQIEQGTFRFKDEFPHHPRIVEFTEKECSNKVFQFDLNFADFSRSWLRDNYELLSRGEKRNIESVLNQHLIPRFGSMSFGDLTRSHIKLFIADLQLGKATATKPLKGKTIRNIISVMRRMVNEAIDMYDWDDWRDIFLKQKLPDLNAKEVEPFTIEEWTKIKAELPAWYAPFFTIAFLTGMRTSEQCALKWCDMGSDTIKICRSVVNHVEQETTKTKKSRREIDIRPQIREVLEVQRRIIMTHYPESEYVFLSTVGSQLVESTLWKVWQRACQNAGVKHRKPYALRHSMISHAILAGEDLQWLARQTGHTDTSMFVKTYWRYINSSDRKDGEKMDVKMRDVTADADGIAVNLAVNYDPKADRGVNTLKTKDVSLYARQDSNLLG
jgi:integrase